MANPVFNPKRLPDLGSDHKAASGISGVELDRFFRMSRFIYIDESGISYLEPVIVVAGVIAGLEEKAWGLEQVVDMTEAYWARENKY
jgi:hypothetical protein